MECLMLFQIVLMGFPDLAKIEVEENKLKETLKDKNMTKEELAFELSN